MFFENSYLKNIILPNNIESIGEEAFGICRNLESLAFGKNSKLTNIGEFAFAGCESLTGSIVIPNNVVSIGDDAFHSCKSLQSITIPSSVTSIGKRALAKTGNGLVVLCKKDSYAEEYAKAEGILVKYI